MADNINMLNLKVNQQNQLLDQYRMNIYNLELRLKLITKILEEKGTFFPDEFEKRWPIFLKNDIGVMGQDGKMEGSCKVRFYGINN